MATLVNYTCTSFTKLTPVCRKRARKEIGCAVCMLFQWKMKGSKVTMPASCSGSRVSDKLVQK